MRLIFLSVLLPGESVGPLAEEVTKNAEAIKNVAKITVCCILRLKKKEKTSSY